MLAASASRRVPRDLFAQLAEARLRVVAEQRVGRRRNRSDCGPVGTRKQVLRAGQYIALLPGNVMPVVNEIGRGGRFDTLARDHQVGSNLVQTFHQLLPGGADHAMFLQQSVDWQRQVGIAFDQSTGHILCAGAQLLVLDPATGELVTGDVTQQTHRVMQNIKAVLGQAGAGFADVVKTTIYLTDLGDFAAVNEAYASYFADAPPARATVQVAALPKGSPVEIEAMAMV